MMVPLEKEIDLMNAYVEIEKARFGDDLKVVFDIDASIKEKILFLSIQPLVENAISHGLRKKGGGGTVTIIIKRIPEGVQVAVEDDGKGIPQDRLSVLLRPETGRGIGLWNIDRRLKEIYGKGLSIESAPDKGTRVAYTVPSEVI
jgi:sensor histidine kinase YesM